MVWWARTYSQLEIVRSKDFSANPPHRVTQASRGAPLRARRAPPRKRVSREHYQSQALLPADPRTSMFVLSVTGPLVLAALFPSAGDPHHRTARICPPQGIHQRLPQAVRHALAEPPARCASRRACVRADGPGRNLARRPFSCLQRPNEVKGGVHTTRSIGWVATALLQTPLVSPLQSIINA